MVIFFFSHHGIRSKTKRQFNARGTFQITFEQLFALARENATCLKGETVSPSNFRPKLSVDQLSGKPIKLEQRLSQADRCAVTLTTRSPPRAPAKLNSIKMTSIRTLRATNESLRRKRLRKLMMPRILYWRGKKIFHIQNLKTSSNFWIIACCYSGLVQEVLHSSLSDKEPPGVAC